MTDFLKKNTIQDLIEYLRILKNNLPIILQVVYLITFQYSWVTSSQSLSLIKILHTFFFHNMNH